MGAQWLNEQPSRRRGLRASIDVDFSEAKIMASTALAGPAESMPKYMNSPVFLTTWGNGSYCLDSNATPCFGENRWPLFAVVCNLG